MSRKSRKLAAMETLLARTRGWYFRINRMQSPITCDCCRKAELIRALLSPRDEWKPAGVETAFVCATCFQEWQALNKELLVARELMG